MTTLLYIFLLALVVIAMIMFKTHNNFGEDK